MSSQDLTVIIIRRVPIAETPALVKVRHRDGATSEVSLNPDEELTVRLARNEQVSVSD